MSEKFVFTIDGVEVEATQGQTILEAAADAGIYIPSLCYMKDLIPHGSCRVCTVKVDGRFQAGCVQPAAPGIKVENDTPELLEIRRDLIEMLFVEGNHYCMFCEKSGDCELQALGYRFGIAAPKYKYLFPDRKLDATHPDIFIDRNRCVLCGRCVNASRDIDGKTVFEFVGRGIDKAVAVNSEVSLSETDLSVDDKAIDVCPVGCIIRKHEGFKTPIGQRKYDHEPIGSDIESRKA